ncbi:MAG: alpha/beta fold hydrolase [Nitriliruptorales bacterium]
MRSLEVDVHGPVHVADFGGEGRPIVLIHGLGGSHLNWLAVAPALAEHGHVVAPDLAGFGRTPLAGRSAAVLPQRDLLLRYLKQEIGEPAVIVGNSMGGLITLLVAARAPHLVEAVVTVGAALPLKPRDRLRRANLDPRVVGHFAAYMVPGLAQRLLERRYEKLGPEGVTRDVLELCTVDVSRVHEDVVAAHMELARERADTGWTSDAFLEAARSMVPLLLRRRKIEELVARIEAPGLVIQGSEDRLVPAAAAQRLAQVRPDWTFEEFPDVGHVPQLEAADRFVTCVTGWIGGLGAAAAA